MNCLFLSYSLSLWERVRVRATRPVAALTPALSQRERGQEVTP